MKSMAIAKPIAEFQDALAQARTIEPDIIFLFAAPAFFRDQEHFSLYKERLGEANVIGCSTSGEISSQGVLQDCFSMLAISFESTKVRCVHAKHSGRGESYKAGEMVGEQLKGPKLKAVYVLVPGVDVNGSAVLDGMVARLGKNVLICGGLAADSQDFKMTHTMCGGQAFSDEIVAVGFYGDALGVSCGSEGGWRPFGPARRVTRSDQNVLYELDGKPALQLYKQYLGDKARKLPASGLSYPFAILRSDRTTSGLIRSALAIDHENESLVLAGNIAQGCQVCLMHADTAALTQGAAQAAAEALRTHPAPEEGGCALVASCVGRLAVLGIDVDDEIEAIVDSFLPNTPIAGFYAYGEISTNTSTATPEMHSQTMTVMYMTESKGEQS